MYAQPTLNGTPVIPTTYANITTFGNTSVKIIPIPATYQSGYLAGQGFPAENENYLMFNLTNSVNAIANDLANIHAEILTVLSGQSIPVNNSATQLNTAIGSKITSTITGTYINNALTGAGINTVLVAYGGNVGIGRSPSSTLDVNGNINGNSVSIAGVSIGTSLTTLQTNINTVDSKTLMTYSELDSGGGNFTYTIPNMGIGENKLVSIKYISVGSIVLTVALPSTGTYMYSGSSLRTIQSNGAFSNYFIKGSASQSGGNITTIGTVTNEIISALFTIKRLG